MKVLFIYTDINSEVGYSSGIAILSAMLKKEGHETRLIHISDELNYPLDTNRINRDITEYEPGLICFSITTNQLHFVRIIGEAIKAKFDFPIAVGGHHSTADSNNLIAENWVDILCRGEGDAVICTLVNNLEKGYPIENIPNLYVKTENGVKKNSLISWIKDIDTLPFDDYELFDYAKIVESRRGWAEAILTRGCPFPCTYCFNTSLIHDYKKDAAENNRPFKSSEYTSRRRSVDKSIRLLKMLKKKYSNIKGFTFVDDVLAMDGEWLEHFVERYADEIKLPYACTSQPLLFNEKIAKLLKGSGCKVVKMGIESGNEILRKQLLKRNITNSHLVKVFGIAKKYGLKPQAFNMIGLPGETQKNILETIKLNARIKPYIVWLSTFNPYPGTELFKQCKINGMIDEEKWKRIDNYRSSSILKSEFFASIEFVKLRVLFRWYLNKHLSNKAYKVYNDNINEISALPDEEWLNGSAEQVFDQRDLEIDTDLRKRDISHYIRLKYINLFWGTEYDYDIT